MVIGLDTYGMVIGNEAVVWDNPKDLGRYDKSLQIGDSAVDQSMSASAWMHTEPCFCRMK